MYVLMVRVQTMRQVFMRIVKLTFNRYLIEKCFNCVLEKLIEIEQHAVDCLIWISWNTWWLLHLWDVNGIVQYPVNTLFVTKSCRIVCVRCVIQINNNSIWQTSFLRQRVRTSYILHNVFFYFKLEKKCTSHKKELACNISIFFSQNSHRNSCKNNWLM